VPLEPIIDTLRTLYAEQRESLPAWIEKNKLEIYFLGILGEEARSFFKRLDVTAVTIPSGKLRRYPSAYTAGDILFRLPLGIFLALARMWGIMPDVVISKGGYGSVPITLAAVFYRVPIILHESDAASGLANRLMARWASVITVGFASTRDATRQYHEKTIVTGTPIRASLRAQPAEAAKRAFGFPPEMPVLLVMGGSQGAQQLNDILLQILPSLLPDMGIIHLTGPKHLEQVRKSAAEFLKASERRDYYKPFSYLTDQMGPALAAADVVVTRAGATSLAELARLHKAAIIIPLDSAAQDHQRLNAQVFETAAAARVIDPANLGRALLEQNIRSVMENKDIRETLENNIELLDRPHAARDIAWLAFKLAQGLVPRQPKVNSPAKSAT
jgi:UDP-N-acetylglucosamine--N-acetylmuramyl-(pentapeptide) pyrophosphoryl-undecaprenol N-acetylglucosamine transferase